MVGVITIPPTAYRNGNGDNTDHRLTVEATKTAAQKYLNGDNYIRLALMSEN